MADMLSKRQPYLRKDGTRRDLVTRSGDGKHDRDNDPKEAAKIVAEVDRQAAHNYINKAKHEKEAIDLVLAMKKIDAEMSRINERYLPLCARLKERKIVRKKLQAALDTTITQIQNLSHVSHRTKVRKAFGAFNAAVPVTHSVCQLSLRPQATASIEQSKHQSKNALSSLHAARGYNGGPGSTHSHILSRQESSMARSMKASGSHLDPHLTRRPRPNSALLSPSHRMHRHGQAASQPTMTREGSFTRSEMKRMPSAGSLSFGKKSGARTLPGTTKDPGKPVAAW